MLSDDNYTSIISHLPIQTLARFRLTSKNILSLCKPAYEAKKQDLELTAYIGTVCKNGYITLNYEDRQITITDIKYNGESFLRHFGVVGLYNRTTRESTDYEVAVCLTLTEESLNQIFNTRWQLPPSEQKEITNDWVRQTVKYYCNGYSALKELLLQLLGKNLLYIGYFNDNSDPIQQDYQKILSGFSTL